MKPDFPQSPWVKTASSALARWLKQCETTPITPSNPHLTIMKPVFFSFSSLESGENAGSRLFLLLFLFVERSIVHQVMHSSQFPRFKNLIGFFLLACLTLALGFCPSPLVSRRLHEFFLFLIFCRSPSVQFRPVQK